LAALLALTLGGAAAVQCTAMVCRQNGPPLVELYTSEGCDSCPPADRWLSSLGAKGYAPERVVPIALHVDYWDYIGWKDPYARQAHSARQRKMAKLAARGHGLHAAGAAAGAGFPPMGLGGVRAGR
jgi:hypothetical protein